jgi:hypothetical protein
VRQNYSRLVSEKAAFKTGKKAQNDYPPFFLENIDNI